MSFTITVPAGFSYVLAALLSTSFVLRWQSDYMVSKARKAAGIPYPQMYAEKAEHAASKAAQVFNCTQRAHQNTLEGLPAILVTTLISAIYSPLVAASACGFWSFARILYTLGYSTGEPKRRQVGNVLGYVSILVLHGYAVKAIYELMKAGI